MVQTKTRIGTKVKYQFSISFFTTHYVHFLDHNIELIITSIDKKHGHLEPVLSFAFDSTLTWLG